ncbi:MAG: hypothetical protein N2038_14970 [Geminicoccaceae bacterium]|nr:hypothetical protein [Geminicoccaceae bacterium]
MATLLEGGYPWDAILSDEELEEEQQYLWRRQHEWLRGRMMPCIDMHPFFYPYEDRFYEFEHYMHRMRRFALLTEAERDAVYERIARYIPPRAVEELRKFTDEALAERAKRIAEEEAKSPEQRQREWLELWHDADEVEEDDLD